MKYSHRQQCCHQKHPSSIHRPNILQLKSQRWLSILPIPHLEQLQCICFHIFSADSFAVSRLLFMWPSIIVLEFDLVFPFTCPAIGITELLQLYNVQVGHYTTAWIHDYNGFSSTSSIGPILSYWAHLSHFPWCPSFKHRKHPLESFRKGEPFKHLKHPLASFRKGGPFKNVLQPYVATGVVKVLYVTFLVIFWIIDGKKIG